MFVFFLFIEKMEKLLATLKFSFISFFFLKWNYGKLGDRYTIFLFFSFFEQNGKNEKMVRINIIFSCFWFFDFLGKTEKSKNDLGLGDYFIFLTFLTILRK